MRILGFLLYFNDPNDPIYKHFFRGGKSEANREVVCVLRVVCIGLVHETLLYSTKFQSDLKLNSIFDRWAQIVHIWKYPSYKSDIWSMKAAWIVYRQWRKLFNFPIGKRSKLITKVFNRTSKTHFIFIIQLNDKVTSFTRISANTWGKEECEPRTVVQPIFVSLLLNFNTSMADLSHSFFFSNKELLHAQRAYVKIWYSRKSGEHEGKSSFLRALQTSLEHP